MEFTINSEENLIDLIVQCMNDESITGSLILSDNMKFNIKLNGNKWDGQIDQNTVAILDGFYDSLFRALRQSDNNIPRNIRDKIRVIATVDEGCENIIVELKDIISYIKDMDANQIMATASIVLVLTIGYTAKQVIDAVKEKNKQKHEQEMAKLDVKERELELNNMLEMYKSNATLPMQTAQQAYIQAKSQMDDDDTLTIVSTNKEYNKEELSAEFVSIDDEIDIQTYYVDGEYYVTERKNKKSNSATIQEKNSNKTIRDALVLLSDTEKAILAEHLDKKTIVKLQVTIEIDNNKNIISSTIVGMGDARNNTQNIVDILK